MHGFDVLYVSYCLFYIIHWLLTVTPDKTEIISMKRIELSHSESFTIITWMCFQQYCKIRKLYIYSNMLNKTWAGRCTECYEYVLKQLFGTSKVPTTWINQPLCRTRAVKNLSIKKGNMGQLWHWNFSHLLYYHKTLFQKPLSLGHFHQMCGMIPKDWHPL